ncbi:hypothetical protein HHK36_023836 [Tetracentron sinense]|uniref:Rab3GAP catalytic subunit conserved domain-containing protein n=1 Tax=Tetracentron sinense TaxID=13715 RepID=A0A835D679_TETSI|nr:hypothetical protein HHK36_023836 [Tetracentron sinense]
MEPSSFVSKAKTAFHSAAAKAEKVLTDIKADLKTDREIEAQSQKSSKKLSEIESFPVNKQEEHSREKPAHLSKKKDWQVRMKNMRRGKTGTEEKEMTENSNSAVLALDENLSRMDLGNVSEAKDSERVSTAEEEGSISTNMSKISPASVLKQLAIAVEAGKKFKSMKDILTSARGSSPLRERASLSFSAVKSLVLREKEEKLTSEYGDDDKVLSLIHSLFDAEEHLPRWKNGSDSASLTMITLPREIHAAPPESFVVKLSEVTGSFKTLRKMALFWCRVVAEVRRLWSEGQPVPGVPLDEIPDLNSCLLHQQLQVINCCISRKRRRTLATESLEFVMGEASPNIGESAVSLGMVSSSPLLYARISSGDLVLRLGADHPSELTMLETGELVYSPVTQEGPLLTEDLIRETEEFVLRTGSVGAGCSQLLSDMQAFKAANPGCILEDFVRWHSPPDWEPSDETEDSFDGEDTSTKRGQLSGRMQKEGNLWRELWETAKPLPAVKQTPLFDEDMAVESILNILEEIPPSELFKQMFISLLGSGFVIAEATSSVNSNLLKLFYECKDFIVATCQGDTWIENVDDLCQVYETVETILIHPEDALKIMKQSEETTTAGEPKRRFKRLSLNFGGKDIHFLRKPASKDQKHSEENPKNSEENAKRQVFSNLFDGKSSIFAKKPPKPGNAPQADTTPSPAENGWTIV